MGGCYSSASHRAQTSPTQKQPKDRRHRNSKKAVHYSPVSATNGDAPHQQDTSEGSSCLPVSIDDVLPLSLHLPEDAKEEKGIMPSDSGIESVGSPQEECNRDLVSKTGLNLCQSCHDKLQKITRGSCDACGHVRVDTSELSALVKIDTYCTCGPRRLGKSSACKTHGVRGRAVSADTKSDSPSIVLKSNMKKQILDEGKCDSYDMMAKGSTCLCPSRNGASNKRNFKSYQAPLAKFDSVDNELDEETEGEDECDGSVLARQINMYGEILHLTDYICKCDFSSEQSAGAHLLSNREAPVTDSDEHPGNSATGSLGKPVSFSACADSVRSAVDCSHGHSAARDDDDDDDSGHGMSKSENRSGSTSDSELEAGVEVDDKTDVSTPCSPMRYAAAGVLENMCSEGEDLVYPMTVEGRQMVMMDAKTYTQMLNDLAVLKEQLHCLTQVIQEDTVIRPLDLSLPVASE